MEGVCFFSHCVCLTVFLWEQREPWISVVLLFAVSSVWKGISAWCRGLVISLLVEDVWSMDIVYNCAALKYFTLTITNQNQCQLLKLGIHCSQSALWDSFLGLSSRCMSEMISNITHQTRFSIKISSLESHYCMHWTTLSCLYDKTPHIKGKSFTFEYDPRNCHVYKCHLNPNWFKRRGFLLLEEC